MIPEPDIPLVYLHGGNMLGERLALVAPAAGESMGVLLRQMQQLPGYTKVWRGVPASVLEVKAKTWVVRQPNKIGVQNNANGYMDYRYPLDPARGFSTARKSFASAVAVLGQLAGHVPEQVLVVKLREVAPLF